VLLHRATLAAPTLVSVRILCSSNRSPDRRDQMIFRGFAVSDETCTSLAHSNTGPRQIFSQPLIMLNQTSELQLRHPLPASGARAHHSENMRRVRFIGVCAGQAPVKGAGAHYCCLEDKKVLLIQAVNSRSR